MKARTLELQRWLNIKGIAGYVQQDGVPGPQTRQAILDTFSNKRAPAITGEQLTALAMRLRCTVKQIAAVARVESAGGGFLPSGQPKLLWERHYFWRRMRIVIPLLSNPAPGGYTIDADNDGINDSWEKMADAMMLNPRYAVESASWGKFQVMGAWWKDLGYRSSFEFAWRMRESEYEHYEVLARYIEKNGMLEAVRALSTNPEDCRAFAKGYNGPAYAKHGYHTKLAAAMR